VRWVVGDIQGCARELDDLLREIRFDEARDELWSVGDLVNRGPDSVATVRLWRDLGGHGVIGNHEVYALCSRSGRWPRKTDTLQAMRDDEDADALYAALRELPLLAKLPARDAPIGDTWLVHGGLHPEWTDLDATAERIAAADDGTDDWLEHPDVRYSTRLRVCWPDGERVKFHGKPGDRPEGTEPWDALYRGERWVVHGHWAWRGHYRNERRRVIGLDSACLYGGRLTAWCMEEDRVASVPARSR
jgi:bis(5'-nucleosyl)-tetraphosphatase (symmetrical)